MELGKHLRKRWAEGPAQVMLVEALEALRSGRDFGVALQELPDSVDAEDRRDLRGAPLSGLDLRGVNLSGVRLDFADLTGANLGFARLLGCDANEVAARGVVLDGADLTGASLMACDLEGASLRGANLQKTLLARCALVMVDFACADLRGANLDGSTLDDANFGGADLAGVSCWPPQESYAGPDLGEPAVRWRAAELSSLPDEEIQRALLGDARARAAAADWEAAYTIARELAGRFWHAPLHWEVLAEVARRTGRADVSEEALRRARPALAATRRRPGP